MRYWPVVVLAALVLAGCSQSVESNAHTSLPSTASGEAWPAAEHVLQADSRWLGSDGSTTTDLGGGRILWTFGDSTVQSAGPRGGAVFLHNTVALQTGRDPTNAAMKFYWRETNPPIPDTLAQPLGLAPPSSFFPDNNTASPSYWYWPNHGSIVGDHLLLFMSKVQSTGSGSFGFKSAGWTALLITNPSDTPDAWKWSEAKLPNDAMEWGTGVVVHDSYLYAFADRGAPDHDLALARWPLNAAASGDLTHPEYWCGSWSNASDCLATVVAAAAPGVTVLPIERGWALVQTDGFGAADIDVRFASNLTGPWGAKLHAYHPPEADAPNALIYGVEAHPEMTADGIAATYFPQGAQHVKFATLHW